MKEIIVKILNYKDVIDGIRVNEDDICVPSNYQEAGELVRCKDCKHMVEHKGYGYLGEPAYICEGNMGGWIYPNSFCSNAKRKEE